MSETENQIKIEEERMPFAERRSMRPILNRHIMAAEGSGYKNDINAYIDALNKEIEKRANSLVSITKEMRTVNEAYEQKIQNLEKKISEYETKIIRGELVEATP